MAYPTTYTWPLIQTVATSATLAPSTFMAVAPPTFGGQDARKSQFERGIKFANVPGGRADFVVHGGPRVYHVNSVPNLTQRPSDQYDLSGVVRFRFRNANLSRVPDSVRHVDFRHSDRYANPIFPGTTGEYPPGFQLITFDDGFWNVHVGMATPRSRYAGDRIYDGRLVVIGGMDGTATPLASCEYYSTGTGVWSSFPALPNPKSQMGFTILSQHNGDLFVWGGSGSDNLEGQRTYRWTTGSAAWTQVSSSIQIKKDSPVVELLDGRVFVPGGTGYVSGSTALPFTGSELFEPDTNTWTGTLGLPLPPYDREGYTLTLLSNGYVLMAGGRDPIDKRNSSHSFLFKPGNKLVPGDFGSWEVLPSMSFARSGHSAVLLDDGKVLVAGGAGGVGPNLQAFFPFSLGGQHGSTKAIAEVEVFDPNTKTWTPRGQMRKSRSNFAMVPLRRVGAEGRVLVAGGQDGGLPVSGSEILDVENYCWHEITPMQVGVFNHLMLPIYNAGAPFVFFVPSGERSGSLAPATGSQLVQTSG